MQTFGLFTMRKHVRITQEWDEETALPLPPVPLMVAVEQSLQERRKVERAAGAVLRRRTGVRRRHWARVAARDLAERPVEHAERLPHVLAQLVHHRVHRVLDAGVDAVRDRVGPDKSNKSDTSNNSQTGAMKNGTITLPMLCLPSTDLLPVITDLFACDSQPTIENENPFYTKKKVPRESRVPWNLE